MPKNRDPVSVTRLQSAVTELAKLQDELRERMCRYLGTDASRRIEVQRLSGLHRTQLEGFLERKVVVVGKSRVEALCQLGECQDVASQIVDLGVKVSDRRVGLTLCVPDAVVLAFELFARQEEHAVVLSTKDFPLCFSTQLREVVSGVFRGATEAYLQLNKEQVRRELREQMAAEFDERVSLALEERNRERQIAATELEQLVQQLQPRYGHRTGVARALGLSPDTLCNALRSRVEVTKVRAMIQKAAGLKPDEVIASAPRAKANPKEGQPAPQKGEEGLRPEDVLAHDPTEDIPEEEREFIITRDSFRRTVRAQVLDLEAATVTAARILRMHLKAATLLTDPDARAILRERLGEELWEVLLMMKAFGDAHPHRYVEYIDDARRTVRRPTKKPAGGKQP